MLGGLQLIQLGEELNSEVGQRDVELKTVHEGHRVDVLADVAGEEQRGVEVGLFIEFFVFTRHLGEDGHNVIFLFVEEIEGLDGGLELVGLEADVEVEQEGLEVNQVVDGFFLVYVDLKKLLDLFIFVETI